MDDSDATTHHRPQPPAEPKSSGHAGAIEGTDAGALGVGDPPPEAPAGAEIESAEHRVPGADLERPLTEAKPWYTSLAAESEQAGVANDEPDAQDAAWGRETLPPEDDEAPG